MAKQTFVWRGTDRAGRKTSGELLAPDRRFAEAKLRRQGVAVTQLRRKAGFSLRFGERVHAADTASFARQLATLLGAGVPLLQAFDIIGSGARPALANVAQGLRNEVAAGASLSSALGKFPALFDPLQRGLVRVAEQSGALDAMLERIASHLERAEAVRRKVKKALTYPLLVIVASIGICAALLVYVVPQFEQVFAGAGAELPAFTRFVIRCSDLLQETWWMALLVIIGGSIGCVVLQRRSQRFRDALDRLSLRVPIAGGILANAAVARSTRALATVVAAGVPLVDALNSVADAAGNALYTRAVRRARDEVATGNPLHAALGGSGVFPDPVVQMVAIGEQSGRLDEMLARIAEQHEAEVNDAVDNLTTLIEPMTMAILGVLVGSLVIAMYLPVFQLGQVFG